jgi:gliding motility-associated-like protein
MSKFYLKQSLLIIITLINLNLFGQQAGWGNTFIYSTAELALYGSHSFRNANSGSLSGIIGTERSSTAGTLSFVQGASWDGASDNAYVDGYVKTYQTGAFIFPIGDNGTYRPASVSAASVASPAVAAYFKANPTTAVTSSLFGGNEFPLPVGAPFNTANKSVNLSKVSTIEYWDINGAASAKITLSWNTASGLSGLIGTDLSKLTIAGWDGTKWVRIQSKVDDTSLFNASSTINAGSITTTYSLPPNTFNVYTLAAVSSLASTEVIKYVKGPVLNSDNTYSLQYIIKVLNNTDMALESVQIQDNLDEVFQGTGFTYAVTQVVASGQLLANGLYNGSSNINTLDGTKGIPANQSDSVIISLNINLNDIQEEKTISNKATLAYSTVAGSETAESNIVDTSIGVSLINLPEGFSPNGDNLNDTYVVGAPNDTKIEVEIINRWGRTVYVNHDYLNDWDGKGTGNFLGKDLPDGTYYMIYKATNRTTGKVYANGVKYITLRR